MSTEVFGGSKVPLKVVLQDGATDRFPRAHLFKDDGSELAGSPFALAHTALGLYVNNAFTAAIPDKRYTAVYRIYDDALFTEESVIYAARTSEVFDIVPGLQAGVVSYYVVRVPDVLQLPTAGNKLYRFVVYFYDSANNLVDPDSNDVKIHIEDIGNSMVVLPTSITREEQGVYWYKYQVTSADVQRPLWVEFSYESAGIPYLVGSVTETRRDSAALDVLENTRLTAARALKLDNLDAAVTSREADASAVLRYNAIQANVDVNEGKIDNVVSLFGPLSGGNVAAHLNLIKTETDKIGNPATGTVAGALTQIEGQTVLLGSPFTASHAGDMLAIYNRLGAPVGLNFSADIAAVKADTNKIGSPFTGTVAGDDALILARIGSPVVSLAADLANVQSTASGINTKLGTPAGASVSADIAAIKADEVTLLSRLTSGRALLIDNLDVPVSSRYSSVQGASDFASEDAKLDAILGAIGATPNNTAFVGIVPSVMVLPAAGNKDYKFYVNLFNTDGTPGDPDADTVTLTVTDVNGVSVAGPTTMVKLATGRYVYTYQVTAADQERSLYVNFDYQKSAVPFHHVRVTEVQEFESKLDTLLGRLSSTRASNLDFLDVAVSTRHSTLTAAAQVASLLASIAGVQADTDAIQAALGTPVTSVSADLASVLSWVVKIGNPATGTLAGALAQIKTEADKIGNPTFSTVAADLAQMFLRIGTPVASIAADLASVKLDTNKIGSPAGGSLSASLNDIRANMGTLGGATTLQSLIQGIDLSTVIAILGAPTGASLAADIAALESHLDSQDTQANAIFTATGAIPGIVAALPPIAAAIANVDADLAAFANSAGVSFTAISNAIANVDADIGNPVPSVSLKLDAISTAVAALPLGSPLQDNDPRLNNLDATVSSRATPADVGGGGGGSSNVFELVGIIEPDDAAVVGILESGPDDGVLVGVVEEE